MLRVPQTRQAWAADPGVVRGEVSHIGKHCSTCQGSWCRPPDAWPIFSRTHDVIESHLAIVVTALAVGCEAPELNWASGSHTSGVLHVQHVAQPDRLSWPDLRFPMTQVHPAGARPTTMTIKLPPTRRKGPDGRRFRETAYDGAGCSFAGRGDH